MEVVGSVLSLGEYGEAADGCFSVSLPLPLFLKSKNRVYLFIYKDFIYFQRGEGREKEKARNINLWLPLAHPHWGASLQPRHVP